MCWKGIGQEAATICRKRAPAEQYRAVIKLVEEL